MIKERDAWDTLLAELRIQKVCAIQMAFRSYLARRTVSALTYAKRGREIKACLVLQAAWRGYYQRVRVHELRKMLRVEMYARILSRHVEDSEMISYDVEDARSELSITMKALEMNGMFTTAMKAQCVRRS